MLTRRTYGWSCIELAVAMWMTFFIADVRVHAQTSKETIDAAIESKHKQIEVELKSIENHAWAGIYKQIGTDEVSVIAIAPSGKIVEFEIFRGVHYWNCGFAKAIGQEIDVNWDYGEGEGRLSSLGDRLLVVPWGNATFLIPRSEIHSFCLDYRDADARTRAPEHYNYLRVKGEAILEGKPQLPDEFKLFWDLPLIKCK